VTDDQRTIAAAFDERSARYGRNQWHRVYADALVALTPLQPGQRVLDAGTGTGFAALAIAPRVAPGGRIVAVDVSAGMLERARAAVSAAGIASIELVEGDATTLPAFADGSFDVVVCSAALLYMPIDRTLQEWHRLLDTGGHVAFSSMRAGSPAAGRVFRACAAEYGLILDDPSAPLGSEDRCRDALRAAGFRDPHVAAGEIMFSAGDLEMAWESNLRSAAHAPVRSLGEQPQEMMRQRFEAARRREEAGDPEGFARAHVLYAFARK